MRFSKISGENTGLILLKYLIYNITTNGTWGDAKAIWINSIEKQLPHVSSAIANTDYKNARSWLDFVGEIFKGLEERHDKVTHPFWIKRILELAEAWYSSNDKVVDKRKNDTKDQILTLYAQGVTQAEISRKLNKSPARVSKIIKQARQH
jgi:hypothetical protein